MSVNTTASEVTSLSDELLHDFLHELGSINVNPVGIPRCDPRRRACITRFHVMTIVRASDAFRLPGAPGGEGDLLNVLQSEPVSIHATTTSRVHTVSGLLYPEEVWIPVLEHFRSSRS
jgi:hypothetical protein